MGLAEGGDGRPCTRPPLHDQRLISQMVSTMSVSMCKMLLCWVWPSPWPGELFLMAIPLVLPMGRMESPPYFCTTTETIVDLANLYSHSTWDPPSHPLEVPSATAAPWDGHLDRIPSTNPGAEPPRDAGDSGSARSHSTHLKTSSSDRP